MFGGYLAGLIWNFILHFQKNLSLIVAIITCLLGSAATAQEKRYGGPDEADETAAPSEVPTEVPTEAPSDAPSEAVK